LVLFFVIVVAGVIIGFLGSSDFHANVQTTLSTVNDKINGINSTIYDTYNQLTTSLVSVNATIPTGSLQTLEKTSADIAQNAASVNSDAEKYDGMRNHATIVVYVFVTIPLLLGLVGAIIGKGKLAFGMSVLLPFGILLMWLVFSMYYSVFIVNVDACYEIDTFLLGNVTNNDNPLSFVFDCANSTEANTLIEFVSVARNQTNMMLNSTTNQTLAHILKDQITFRQCH